jgi:prefoldin subunit 5
VRSHPAATEANPALDLLEKAHAHLIDRKRSIEADLARLTDLTNELDAINTQIQALDKTLGVFKA